ncbi:PP2C family protein-serine/threonine phosphatase [Streptomyces sp. WMMB 322]|uniref:PP2C family protein-serine/threonine phosphatase n=1 Tax=Streptomyces sp. WMMB 322 TaxID=1286821 RepID=UPI0006E40BA0|nr:PP2C family protein-serine/threonine phosphatase [Streptomyces sp. WMMB 322]SCK48317.1 Serine phosphatase RsbU, regulator of sigma subunit [Streptomyces sp. WMMB 322]
MDRFAVVERALRAAAPHELPEVVTKAMRQHYDALDVRLRMADYGVRTLQAVEPVPFTTEPVPIHDSPPGRAFGAQEPVVELDPAAHTLTAHLAVSVRGDRVGVLSVVFPEHIDIKPLLGQLEQLGMALGHEIMVAERDTDMYLLARRASRLTLAAEMQWQLLPGRSCRRSEFALGAHLEPAYAIFGDNYDWSASADHLTLSITNGMGEGIEAALLTNLAVNAMRNARRAGLGLADQACLADQAIYARYDGQAYVSMLLLRFELLSGRVEVVEAGSPRTWRVREGKVEPLHFEAQLPLGMFEDTLYVAQRFDVRPGDRLLFASDGVYNTVSSTGEHYGESSLTRALNANRLLPAAQVPQAVLRDLAGYRGVAPLDDDALVLCVDWHGRGAAEGGDGH